MFYKTFIRFRIRRIATDDLSMLIPQQANAFIVIFIYSVLPE